MDIDLNYWSKKNSRIFISHVSTHKNQANELKRALENIGYRCFVAHDDISPSKEWQKEIIKALSITDVFVSMHYKGFEESTWCQQEIGFALKKGVKIIPLKFEMDPKGFISSVQALNVKSKNFDEIANLINDII